MQHQYQCDDCGLIGGIAPELRARKGQCVACGGTSLHVLAPVFFLVPMKHGQCTQCTFPAEYVVDDTDDAVCVVHAAQAASEGKGVESLDDPDE